MYEENKLEQLYGKGNPFKVPDSYFHDFEKQLLNNLDRKRLIHKSLLRRMSPWIWAAASSAAVLLIGLFYINGKDFFDNHHTPVATRTNVTSVHENGQSYIEQFTDYAMLDNSDLYSYVVGE